MTWEEYYDNYYGWAESTAIKKLSSVDMLGNADEVAEIISDMSFHHKDICNRIARKAIGQKLVFSWENLQDIDGCVDNELQIQLLLQSYSSFSKEDLEDMVGLYDDEVIDKLYKLKGLPIPEREPGLAESINNFVNYVNDLTFEEPEPVPEKKPGGFFSRMAMAFGIGHGIHQGISDATRSPVRKFRVGDHVRVRYRGQEGTVIDINGDLYMVSLSSGGVDSYTESQLERAW